MTTSYAARVVQQEQVHQYFSQLGILKGQGLTIGEGRAETSHKPSSSGGGDTDLSDLCDDDDPGRPQQQGETQTRQPKRASVSLSQSLKMFLPRQRDHRQEESYPPPSTQDATPLERFLTLDGCSGPSYLSRVAVTQAGCYGQGESIATRQHQAQLLAEQVVREAQTHRRGSPDSMKHM
jgi:hypothetical protein